MKEVRTINKKASAGPHKKNLAFAAVTIASVLFLVFLIIYMYNSNLKFSQPLTLDDYTSPDSPWSYYMIEDGKKVELTANDTDSGAVIKSFRPVYCETRLDYVIENAVLDLGRVNGDVAVFLGDNFLYSNCDYRLDENGVEFCGDLRLSSDDTIVSLPDKYEDKTLQAVFLPSDGKVVLPQIKLTNIKTIFGEESVNVLDGIVRAVCSLLFTVLTLFLFIAEKYKGKTDVTVLILVIYFTLNVIVPINLEYSFVSDSIVEILNDYRVGEFILALATAIMLMFFTSKAQHYSKKTVVFAAGYVALLPISYIVACFLGVNAVALVLSFSYILYYFQLFFVLFISVSEWRRGSFFFKYYTVFFALGIVVLILWSLYSYGASTLWQGDLIRFLALTKRTFFQPYLSSCVAIILTVEFLVNTLRNEMAVHALTMQNQLTQEYINNLDDTIVAVRKTRHEMRHHIETMCIMAENKYYDRLEAYLQNLCQLEKNSSPLYYSENKIVSAVISSKLRDVKAKGIETDVSVNIPEHLPLNSMAFSSFLMNLLENAVEACDRLPQGNRRWIKLKINIKNGKLTVGCANSSYGSAKKTSDRYVTSKKDADNHGFGISIMQQCCESVGGSMVIEDREDSFAVRAVFPIENENG